MDSGLERARVRVKEGEGTVTATEGVLRLGAQCRECLVVIVVVTVAVHWPSIRP